MISRACGASNSVGRTARYLVMSIMGTVLMTGASTLFFAAPANAKPEFSAQTKLPCGQCHANPAGGGKLKSFGEKFKAKGNKL